MARMLAVAALVAAAGWYLAPEAVAQEETLTAETVVPPSAPSVTVTVTEPPADAAAAAPEAPLVEAPAEASPAAVRSELGTAEAEAPELTAPATGEEGPRAVQIQSESIEAQIQPEPEPAIDLSEANEIGLVEEVAKARKAYERSLKALKDYYLQQGSAYKIEWVEAEMDAVDKLPRIRYLTIPEMTGAEMKPSKRIPAADQLYKEGMDYKNYPAFPPGKKDYLRLALEKFETIIQKYPESDKIDDAAFRMGEIYGGWYFEDWVRAVQAYERAFEWDPSTPYPALLNAAKIYEEKLRDRGKAVELYRQVVMHSPDPKQVEQAAGRIRALTGS